MTRMLSLALVVLVVALLLWMPVGEVRAQGEEEGAEQVETEYGAVEGIATDAYRAFLGVPYAAPPVGSLRWRSPAAPEPWSPDVRPAVSNPPSCPQSGAFLDYTPYDEDCLYVNVFTPALDQIPPEGLPVMVWIHGGSLQIGGINLPIYNATQLVQQGRVVVVAVNYRLNIFGFAGGDELRNESGDGSHGNYGLLDQQFALQWVQRNIANFGGDPARVTIFGESAGGWSVMFHLVLRGSEGLFDTGINESGPFSPAGGPYQDIESAKDTWDRLSRSLGCDSLDCMRQLPYQDVLDESQAGSYTLYPVIDGVDLVRDPAEMLSDGDFYRVPVILGSNDNEIPFAPSIARNLTWPQYYALVRLLLGEEDGAILNAVYNEDNYESPYRAIQKMLTHGAFSCAILWQAREMQNFVPVYHYEFRQMLSVLERIIPNLGVFHSAELVFVFFQTAFYANDVDLEMGEIVVDHWTSMAYNGEPAAGWPSYDLSNRTSLLFDYTGPGSPLPTLSDLLQPECDALEQVFGVQVAKERRIGQWRRLRDALFPDSDQKGDFLFLDVAPFGEHLLNTLPTP